MTTQRYHALDSLRGFAMLLGVVLHAGISFMQNPPAFWSVRDNDPSPLTDVFMFAVHDFRMQTFFLLAGFFGCLLYRKYGIAGTAWHRVKRVAIPLVLGILLIVPTVMAAFMFVELENARAEGVTPNATEFRKTAADLIATNPEKGNFAIIAQRFTSGTTVPQIPLAHLWFLYYLLYFYAAVLLLAPLVQPLAESRFGVRIDGLFRRVVESRVRVLLPALATLPVLMTMKTPFVDTPLGWRPEWQILGYYCVFFVFGWMLYRHRELVPAFGGGWKWHLALANVAVLPAAILLTFGAINAIQSHSPLVFAWRLAAFAGQALYSWMMIVALWGAFLHFFSGERAWVRYMADASYWCYLASITPIVVFQFVVKDWPLPGLLKWLLVTAATMAVLLASYEWCVRYTFIGALLNGRKYRARERQTEPRPEGSGEPASLPCGRGS